LVFNNEQIVAVPKEKPLIEKGELVREIPTPSFNA
jgi:hypothetical protein